MNIFKIIYNGALDREFTHPKNQRRYDDFMMYAQIVLILSVVVLLMVETTIRSGFLTESIQSFQKSKKTKLEILLDKTVNKIKGKTVTYSTK